MLDSTKGTRECMYCHEVKELCEFTWDKGRKLYRNSCIPCTRAKARERYHRTKGARGSILWLPTEEEIAIIREHYPIGGTSACMALIPGKRAEQIHRVAQRRGIRYAGPHVAGSDPKDEANWPVPAHDYTPADLALRQWRVPGMGTAVPELGMPVGVLSPSLGLVLGVAA